MIVDNSWVDAVSPSSTTLCRFVRLNGFANFGDSMPLIVSRWMRGFRRTNPFNGPIMCVSMCSLRLSRSMPKCLRHLARSSIRPNARLVWVLVERKQQSQLAQRSINRRVSFLRMRVFTDSSEKPTRLGNFVRFVMTARSLFSIRARYRHDRHDSFTSALIDLLTHAKRRMSLMGRYRNTH